MTIDEILKAQGLTDEQVAAVIKSMDKNKLSVVAEGEENLTTRYGKLKTDFENLTAQHGESTKLIEQLKKDNAGNQALQRKVTDYETQISELSAQLKQSKINAAVQLALVNAKALDTDYLAYKLGEKGELELDDNGNIKGIDDKIAALKTQYPTQFENHNNSINIKEQKLPESDPRNAEPSTLAEALKMQYENKE